jgi:hypothetical protein
MNAFPIWNSYESNIFDPLHRGNLIDIDNVPMSSGLVEAPMHTAELMCHMLNIEFTTLSK